MTFTDAIRQLSDRWPELVAMTAPGRLVAIRLVSSYSRSVDGSPATPVLVPVDTIVQAQSGRILTGNVTQFTLLVDDVLRDDWEIVVNSRIDQFTGEHRFLSNFWPCEVQYANLTFPSVENAYQACKCADLKEAALFVGFTPSTAKRQAKKVRLRADWSDEFRLDAMESLLRQKFTAGSGLAKLLKETGNMELVEGNDWGDTFWGVCNGEGQNHLGKLLMKIRSEL